MPRFLLPLLCCALLATPAPAQDTADRLDRIEAERADLAQERERLAARRAELAHRLDALTVEMNRTSQRIIQTRRDLPAMEVDLRQLERSLAEKQAALAANRTKTQATLRALISLARAEGEVILADPRRPHRGARAALVLNTTAAGIDARAAALAQDLAALDAARVAALDGRAGLDEAKAALAERLDHLSSLMAEHRATLAKAQAAQSQVEARLRRLAAEAEDLRDLIAGLERAGPQPAPPVPQQAGAAPQAPAPANGLPAAGDIVIGFGAPDQFGAPSLGLTIQAAPGAPVLTPLDGVVRFSGEFRGYGRIVIIVHGGCRHSTLAGIGAPTVAGGQAVRRSQPVAAMPLPQNADSLGAGGPVPRLYFEFREDGEPVDPIRGLATASR